MFQYNLICSYSFSYKTSLYVCLTYLFVEVHTSQFSPTYPRLESKTGHKVGHFFRRTHPASMWTQMDDPYSSNDTLVPS